MDATKLDALEGLVHEVDGEGPPTAEQQQAQQAEQQAEDGARNWGMLAFALGKGASMIAPELQSVYTEDACLQWGRSMVPVADKYGWNSPSSMPELALAMTTMALGVPTYLTIKAKLELLREQKAKAEKAAKATAEAGASGGQ